MALIELARLLPGHGQAALHDIMAPQRHGGKRPNVDRSPGGRLLPIELVSIRQGLHRSQLYRMIDKVLRDGYVGAQGNGV